MLGRLTLQTAGSKANPRGRASELLVSCCPGQPRMAPLREQFTARIQARRTTLGAVALIARRFRFLGGN
jgi:hypothetical protein